jgi:hypothetical protein
MKIHARVDAGVVQEIILPRTWGIDDVSDPPKFLADDEQPIEVRFTSDFVAQMVDITGLAPQPASGWVYDGSTFSPLPVYQPTHAEVLASQSAALQALTATATAQKVALTNRIATLQDAIDNVGVEGAEEFAATPEEQIEFPQRKSQLTKWKNYAILLGRVTNQAGWPLEVTWPAQPADGMDLNLSAVAPSDPQLS